MLVRWNPAHTVSWQNLYALKRRNELKLPKYILLSSSFCCRSKQLVKRRVSQTEGGIMLGCSICMPATTISLFYSWRQHKSVHFASRGKRDKAFWAWYFQCLGICETEIVTWGITFQILLGFETYTQEFKTVTVTSFWLIFIKIWGQYHDKTCSQYLRPRLLTT